ncbi:hypothetical protein WQE_31776 [Paraburkholderia hospita]|uniref:Uncharacterized protein n=1 Tax=Paraburkholderia hospita TaxID=169430 RepID=A0ABP2PI81_9BURK|nr:hypothetical protein [Paraburkholderia hospita]EIM96927.1 hypothetical protein WQE_31776 [Paraburkholderia hospita]OUL70381.1 hypothetical protein CA602_48185 [Paraburkholderia hospita]
MKNVETTQTTQTTRAPLPRRSLAARLDKLGHIPMEEAPQRVPQDLREFLAQFPTGRTPLQV